MVLNVSNKSEKLVNGRAAHTTAAIIGQCSTTLPNFSIKSSYFRLLIPSIFKCKQMKYQCCYEAKDYPPLCNIRGVAPP